MAEGKVHIVLLSGGSGTRLWPLSGESRSKQFLKVLRDSKGDPESMVQRAFRKVRGILPDADITVVTCEHQVHSIERQVKGRYALVVEPERRDTAPAIMLASAHLAWEQGAGEDDVVIVMPIDAYADDAYYEQLGRVAEAVSAQAADLVLMGVRPAHPSEKYGYIVPSSAAASMQGAALVNQFVEKPCEADAAALIERGALWNCGVFGFRLRYLMGVVARYADAHSFNALRDCYANLPKRSFDYEVVEAAESVAVVSCSGTWKDLGTWNTLTEEMADMTSGRTRGIETCKGTHVVNELGLPLVVLGLVDVVVAATPDGILVANKVASSQIKPWVDQAKESRPMYEQRRWGEYRVLDAGVYPKGELSLVKELFIKEGRQLSYQLHRYRAEVWTVVSGVGEVVIDGAVRAVRPGSAVQISAGEKHSVRALEGDLRIIEVQTGVLLEENDIERFGDWWDE